MWKIIEMQKNLEINGNNEIVKNYYIELKELGFQIIKLVK